MAVAAVAAGEAPGSDAADAPIRSRRWPGWARSASTVLVVAYVALQFAELVAADLSGDRWTDLMDAYDTLAFRVFVCFVVLGALFHAITGLATVAARWRGAETGEVTDGSDGPPSVASDGVVAVASFLTLVVGLPASLFVLQPWLEANLW